MKNEYLFLAGAAGFSILPSILKRTGITGSFLPAGAPITGPTQVPQGKTLSASVTIKNSGIAGTYGLGFAVGDYWQRLQNGISLLEGETKTFNIVLLIPETAPLGTANMRVTVMQNIDLSGNVIDSSAGTINITSGISASITSVTVTVV